MKRSMWMFVLSVGMMVRNDGRTVQEYLTPAPAAQGSIWNWFGGCFNLQIVQNPPLVIFVPMAPQNPVQMNPIPPIQIQK